MAGSTEPSSAGPDVLSSHSAKQGLSGSLKVADWEAPRRIGEKQADMGPHRTPMWISLKLCSRGRILSPMFRPIISDRSHRSPRLSSVRGAVPIHCHPCPLRDRDLLSQTCSRVHNARAGTHLSPCMTLSGINSPPRFRDCFFVKGLEILCLETANCPCSSDACLHRLSMWRM